MKMMSVSTNRTSAITAPSRPQMAKGNQLGSGAAVPTFFPGVGSSTEAMVGHRSFVVGFWSSLVAVLSEVVLVELVLVGTSLVVVDSSVRKKYGWCNFPTSMFCHYVL